MLLLAHISDLHLDGTARAAERATRVMDHLRALPRLPDALLVTGDIADHGDPAEYEQAAEILSAPFPVLTCPGNHDVRAAYRTALLRRPAADGPVNSLHRIGGTAILMADSTIPDRHDGLLAPETLAWISTSLDELGPDTPALLAFHHPPVLLHHPLPDSIRLGQTEGLAEVLDAYPQVLALLTGHAHTGAVGEFAGRPVRVAPGTVWTLGLPWQGERIADLDAPPGLAFHVVEDGRIVTHFRVVA
ncbi:metallophosphoesterase [Kitasatospora sp. NBC_01287]|uniref:metallophosphoesterase n=1 Tax=Kitasatospora sp. NBC_01287 TaxID=2903573 RepID=UPI002259C557|nr:metallophosphoesterase [Kitasatospora sp. NBC_01287]MCX4744100.1 metallophosphoesterase [Kitasatospora sp. NBC_01287]